MKVRAGNACWHVWHVQVVSTAKELGFFEEEGLDVEPVHAKINPRGILASRGTANPYEEVGATAVKVLNSLDKQPVR